MKVALEGSLRRALLKECLWMGENNVCSEGGQDEVYQQPTLQHQRCSSAKTYVKEQFSKFYYS